MNVGAYGPPKSSTNEFTAFLDGGAPLFLDVIPTASNHVSGSVDNAMIFGYSQTPPIAKTIWFDNIILTPEPSTALLLGLGMIGLATQRRGSRLLPVAHRSR